ncbi:UNVERIFIED_CONTAM: ribosomal protein S18-alanine N-acetyltransferase, partial [Prevotella sp. 15_C9]
CDLLRIAVREDVRGRGVATQLMQYMVYDLKKNGHESIMLEVRESNEKAIALYEKFDFDEISRRKDYYRDPKEDAVVM